MIDFFRIILSAKGYDLKTAAQTLDQIRQMDRSSFTVWQSQKCTEIARWHYDNNPFYHEIVNGPFPDSWEQLPILSKSDFQKPLGNLIAAAFTVKDLYVANTSGSTGNPFYFAKDKMAHALTWANFFHYYKMAGLKPNDLQARFFGIPLSGKSRLVEQIKDLSMNRVRFPVFYLGTDSLKNYLERFTRHKFVYIYGYTNAIRHFAAFVKSKGLILNQVCPTLRAVIVTAEICTPEDQKLIEQATGVPVYIEYGASETGLIAFSDRFGNLKVCDETLFVETTANQEILVTTFFNKAFPIIRYKIGDLATLVRGTDGVQIQSLIGRSDDLVKLPNGNEAAGLTFYYCTRAILEKSSNIREIYFTQKSISNFVISYVSHSDLTTEDKSLIIANIDKMLQPGLELSFERTDQIRRKSNGKFQVFTSELKIK